MIRNLKKTLCATLVTTMLAAAGTAPGATLTVGLDGSTSFSTVQAAINAAGDGDEIVVMPGRYVENLRILGKNIVLRSTAPHDLDVVKATILDGNRAGIVVTFAGTEGTTCVLSGFTITNGRKRGTEVEGGGIWGKGALAAIQYNFIYDNIAVEGGGIYGCNGIIHNNIVSSNIARDSMWVRGGGMAYCLGTIQNNIFIHNALYFIPGPFSYAGGGALSHCDGIVQNNTFFDNANGADAAISLCNGNIRNNIIWGNFLNKNLKSSSIPTFSCIQGWTGGGVGNISLDPLFVNPGNDDYHLRLGSPCINAGIFIPSLPWDIEGNPRVGAHDIGAYEFKIYMRSKRWFLYH